MFDRNTSGERGMALASMEEVEQPTFVAEANLLFNSIRFAVSGLK